MSNDEKRLKIIQATERAFVKRRFHEVTIDEVARIARVSKGTVYLHFKDKDDLFFQAELYRMEEAMALIHENVSEDLPFTRKLHRVCEVLDEYFKDRLPILKLHHYYEGQMPTEKGKRREQWEATRKVLRDYIAQVMQEGVEQGVLNLDLEVDVLSRLFVTMMRSRHMEFFFEPDRIPPIDRMLDLFLYGMSQSASGLVSGSARPENN